MMCGCRCTMHCCRRHLQAWAASLIANLIALAAPEHTESWCLSYGKHHSLSRNNNFGQILAPRFLGMFQTFDDKNPAPSPITKPVRSLSNGIDEHSGSSVVERANETLKYRSPILVIKLQHPPAKTTSCIPNLISRKALPMASLAKLLSRIYIPRGYNLKCSFPAPMFEELFGINIGWILHPRSRRIIWSSNSCKPPIPDVPIHQHTIAIFFFMFKALDFRSFHCSIDCIQWVVSIRFWSFLQKHRRWESWISPALRLQFQSIRIL